MLTQGNTENQKQMSCSTNRKFVRKQCGKGGNNFCDFVRTSYGRLHKQVFTANQPTVWKSFKI